MKTKYYKLRPDDPKHPNAVGVESGRFVDTSYNDIKLDLKNGSGAWRNINEVVEISKEEYVEKQSI